MIKILEIFKQFKHDVHELDNAEKLKNILPQTTVYDIQHGFSQKSTKSEVVTLFGNTLMKQPEVYHSALNRAAYIETNAQNQVLLHGILFKALFDVYMKHTKRGFDNVLLSNSQIKQKNDRIIIDFVEYNNLPKRFRGIFVKYDTDHYVLNTPHSQMIITYNKKNKNTLETLLLRARMLIPVVYKEHSKIVWNDEPEPEDPNLYSGLTVKAPAFVDDSPSARCVSDEQLNAICELHDVFVKISEITTPRKITIPNTISFDGNCERRISGLSNAQDLFYDEYKKELNQKDIFVRAQNNAKTLKADQAEVISNAYKAFKRQKKQLKAKYREYHSSLLSMLATETSVHIK